MKAVILAGGLGTRISEETHLKPKPMIEIGGRPILWHIMKAYSHYGINDFVICCGYKGYLIKEYFANYFLHNSDVSIDLSNQTVDVHVKPSEPWRITLVDTGENTQTGGRLKRIQPYLQDDEHFCFTYGDGLCDVDLSEVIAFHHRHEQMATVVSVNLPPRFGALALTDTLVTNFEEKPQSESGQVNGGFFVLSRDCLNLIKGDTTAWEGEPMAELVLQRELRAFSHQGFWQPMDTLRDKNMLESLWAQGHPPWKVWS
jgi:glucose-1-phosphate cytidylyltransferase